MKVISYSEVCEIHLHTLKKGKKDVFAIIRQLGLPKWFGSFSSADTRWHDLLRVLGKLNDLKDYTDRELEEMDWHKKKQVLCKKTL